MPLRREVFIMLADLHCDTFYKCFADGTDFTSPSLHVSLDKCLGLFALYSDLCSLHT